MKKTFSIILGLVLISAVSSAHAGQGKAAASAPAATPAATPAKNEHGGVAKQGYGAAGCGLGAVVFGSEPGMVQVIAATLNGFFGNQTLGISFGTLNCGAGGAAPTAKDYIDANRSALANDIARGQGETLNGLTRLMGCKDHAKAGTTLQQNYSRIFPNNTINAAKVEENIKTTLHGVCG